MKFSVFVFAMHLLVNIAFYIFIPGLANFLIVVVLSALMMLLNYYEGLQKGWHVGYKTGKNLIWIGITEERSSKEFTWKYYNN